MPAVFNLKKVLFFRIEKIAQVSDNFYMNELFQVIKAVFSNKSVIAAAIGCAVIFEFINYISNYRKKPPKQKFKKIVASVPPASSENDETSASENKDDE